MVRRTAEGGRDTANQGFEPTVNLKGCVRAAWLSAHGGPDFLGLFSGKCHVVLR